MIVLLSPSKAMELTAGEPLIERATTPALLEESEALVEVMRDKGAAEIGRMMKLSEALSALNFMRYQEWDAADTPQRQALLAFTGDTYKDIPLHAYTEADFDEAQRRVRILSGLYGVLRPLDLIRAYRLEMGTRLVTERGADLYAYWRESVTAHLAAELELLPEAQRVVVVCASTEYARAVDVKGLGARVIEPVFKDVSVGSDKARVISFYAKRARGMMADHVVRERVSEPDELLTFTRGGYAWDEASSTPDRPVFIRTHTA